MIDLAMRRDSFMKNVNPPIEAIEGFLDELLPNTEYSTDSDLISNKSLRGTISALSHSTPSRSSTATSVLVFPPPRRACWLPEKV
jgi:hypothetical protein